MPKTEARTTTYETLTERGEPLYLGEFAITLERASGRAAKLKITGPKHLKVIGEKRILLTNAASVK